MKNALLLVWAGLKMAVAVALAPALVALFLFSPKAFLPVFTALWPHLDILGPDGTLYLRRFFMTPKTHRFRPRFLHYIARSDEGRHPHDHPGPFVSRILTCGYLEKIYFPRIDRGGADVWEVGGRMAFDRTDPHQERFALPGMTLENREGHTHMVQLFGPTWTWVVAWKRGKPWGFWIIHPTDPARDRWIESEEYGVKGDEIESWRQFP
jgi:hypothetical protein